MRIFLQITFLLLAAPALAEDCSVSRTDLDDLRFAPVENLASVGSGYRTTAPVPGSHELHVVSSYEGSGTVTVSRSDRPIVLALASYEASRWQVIVEDDTAVEKVLLFGYKPGQRVTGLPQQVEVEAYQGSSGGNWLLQTGSGRTTYVPAEFKGFISLIRCQTGMVEQSYQNAYNLGTQFRVPPILEGIPGPEIISAETPKTYPPLNPVAQMSAYETSREQLSPEFKPAVDLLLSMMRNERFPVFLPTSARGEDFTRPAELLPLDFPNNEETSHMSGSNLSCERDTIAVIGTDEPDTINCAWGNQWFALGDGGDVLTDSWDDDVVLPGAGDDIVNVGRGNDVVVFEKNWGDDVVDKTCHHQQMSETDRERLDWDYKYNSFIVFGDGIQPAGMTWRDRNTLEYGATGDMLTLVSDCFNLVFAEDGDMPKRPEK